MNSLSTLFVHGVQAYKAFLHQFSDLIKYKNDLQ
jgi:hypothetical protein